MLKMKVLLPALLLGLCLPVKAQQVYRSTDAEGNITFSDTPTAGSETINIDTPNLADPVTAPPPQPEPEPEVASEETATTPKSEPKSIQEDVDAETRYLRSRRYYYSNGEPNPRNR